MKYLVLIVVLVSLAAAQNNPGNWAVNNPVIGGGLAAGVANGSVLVSNGVSRPGVYQSKPVIDVRDKTGCGVSDDTTAFNAVLTAIGSTQAGVMLSCQVKLSNITIPSNVTLDGSAGGSIFVGTGQTVTIQGPIVAVPRQIFFNIASGQGALSFSGNTAITTMSPLWFGVDCSGTNDNAPVWNRIVSFVTEDVTLIVPMNCTDKHASTVTVSSRASFALKSADRVQNGGGNQRPIEQWTGSTGGMWDFQANQAPTVEGFLFQNGSSAHLDYFLRFDGNPGARIGTEALVRYNTFTNNMANPGTFDAIIVGQFSSHNHEKNTFTDNDFFCSQSAALKESDTSQISSGSPNVTCGSGTCTYTTDAAIGDRVRVSYAAGILDSTILSITDNNHLVLNANAASNQSNARLTFRQAYGNGITISSTNNKHNTLDRNSFTQCARGVNILTGSFSLSHAGGSYNDALVYLTNVAEPSQLDYLEDEHSMRDVYIAGSLDGQLTMNHLRNSLGANGEFDGFIYFGGAARATITGSVLQDTPPSVNQVVIGLNPAVTVALTSIGNNWAPGVATMTTLGFNQWRNLVEQGASAYNGWLISCGDYGLVADMPGTCFQFGDNSQNGAQALEGHIIVNSVRNSNSASFNSFTAEPNVQNGPFVNEARGFRTSFNGGINSTSMMWVGFDAQFLPGVRGGNFGGFRAGFPTTNTTPMPFARGLWVQAPTANTFITTGTGVYVEDLASHTGITNRYSFYGVGATDTAHFGGPTEIAGNLSFSGNKGQHFNTQAAGNDLAGTVATSSSTTAIVTFTTNYTATPVCVLTPQTTGLTSWYLSAISTSGFTVTVAPSGTYTFGYHCLGNPN